MLNNEQQKFEFSKTDTNTIDIVAFENKYTSVASAIIEISAVLALQQNSPFRNGEAIEDLIAFAIKKKECTGRNDYYRGC
jgi:hypothetical protein